MLSNPAELIYNKYTEPYERLSKKDKAVEKLKHSEIYKNWCLAQKYGPQLYNHIFGHKL